MARLTPCGGGSKGGGDKRDSRRHGRREEGVGKGRLLTCRHQPD
ncbi:hypothetical protein ACW5XW_04070 [Aeromonas piscicola]